MRKAIKVKLVLYLCACMLFCTTAYPNNIDVLQTKADVAKFLATKISPNNTLGFRFEDTVSSFIKVDIDHNGITDLLVKTDSCYLILDTGNAGYDMRRIFAREMEYFDFVQIINVKDQPLLIMKSWRYEYDEDDKITALYDTLIYKFGHFIEYNPHPPSIDVDTIVFSIGENYPYLRWQIVIDSKGWATVHANYYDYIFAGLIDSTTFNIIIQTINYIDIPTLLEKEAKKGDMGPSRQSTATSTYELEIKYSSGRHENIHDFGGLGTYGLRNLYRQLFMVAHSLPELQ